MGNTISSQTVVSGSEQPIYERQTFPRSEKKLVPQHTAATIDTRNHHNHHNSVNAAAAETTSNANNQENSRMLFLMYLINRTWNVVVKR